MQRCVVNLPKLEIVICGKCLQQRLSCSQIAPRPSLRYDDLVVCHGNVIRYSMCRALQLPPNYWLRLATYNCGLTHFQIRATGSVSLFGFGDIGHLDLDQTTYH